MAERERARTLLAGERPDPGNGRDDGDRAVASLRQEETMTTRSRALERVEAVDRALERLDAGEYGHCLDCGGDIAPRRLEAYPAVETCIQCQGRREYAAERGLGQPPADGLEC
jgi:DnaK suppressor protein